MKEPTEVGSNQLLERYGFDVSSATIRNEMVKLMELGFLDKSHVSSGRLPTDMAFRLFVNEIDRPEVNDTLTLVKIRQDIFKSRFSPDQLIKTILELLVEYTSSASFVVLDDMSRHYGVSSLFDYEELKDVDSLRRVLDLLEDENMLRKVFSKYDRDEATVLIGSELGIKDLENCTLAFIKFDFWDNRSGHLGVVGSKRMPYETVIPTLSMVRESVHTSLKGWR